MSQLPGGGPVTLGCAVGIAAELEGGLFDRPRDLAVVPGRTSNALEDEGLGCDGGGGGASSGGTGSSTGKLGGRTSAEPGERPRN